MIRYVDVNICFYFMNVKYSIISLQFNLLFIVIYCTQIGIISLEFRPSVVCPQHQTKTFWTDKCLTRLSGVGDKENSV